MTERISTWHPTDLPARGIPTPELVNIYRRWGEASLGTILTGNIMIDYDQLEAPGNMIIPPKAPFDGERFEGFKQLATEAKKHGSIIVGQVSHPGRQVEDRIQKDPVSASDILLVNKLLGQTFAKPHAASQQEIHDIVENFAHAAEYLDKAGFDGIQLHGAHGYLLAQFLSGRTNHRTDSYGGSLANRARIIVEIAKAVQSRVSNGFVLGIKLNSVEFQEKGFQPEEARGKCPGLPMQKSIWADQRQKLSRSSKRTVLILSSSPADHTKKMPSSISVNRASSAKLSSSSSPT
jgi:2,4-dienoyl-CoA reductase-like NADH-dependent reductase (Old Yellow Enzyme family)